MRDSYKREINYLRISVTDLCNLRCRYCMPEQGVEKFSHETILSVEEIAEIAGICAELGVNKVRLTGGEPLVRRGIIDICRKIAEIPEIRELCITTNGLLLTKYADDLRAAGVDRLNISIDTLQNEKYKELSRCSFSEHPVDDLFEGLEAAKRAGFENTKLNAVLIGGWNDDEITDFVELTKDNDYQVRFIELMPIGEAASWEKECFLPNETVLEKAPELKFIGESGVAKLYQKDGYKGTIGLISPVNHHFCSKCNRLRLTADGKLKACLHSKKETPIRGLHGEELKAAIAKEISNKPENYDLGYENPSSSQRGMSQIGG
ncbi:MAG: GTP 3',8-cyclase MoaA [Lachnospiraceae bacterium]|nr:GTP 3',8-cyclase MoaA [Lachnospiraceae bacterium]